MATRLGTTTQRRNRAVTVHKELTRLFPQNLTTPLRHKTQFQLLVAVILSAQCTDEVVNKVTKKLFQKYRTLDDYVRAKPNIFKNDIRPTGFFNSKTKAILGSAKIIKQKHKGRVPRTMRELLALPGVGRKTANVILGHLFKHVEGIAVDTHVIRLSQKFGITDHTDPSNIEKDLMRLLPKEDWWDFSYRLKEYGRTFSPARKKDDDTDPISRKIRNV